jgi:hypothetical protein
MGVVVTTGCDDTDIAAEGRPKYSQVVTAFAAAHPHHLSLHFNFTEYRCPDP